MRPAIRSGRAGAKSRLSAGESDGRRSRVPPPARLQTPLRKSGPINRQRSCVRGTGNEPGPIRLQNQSGLPFNSRLPGEGLNFQDPRNGVRGHLMLPRWYSNLSMAFMSPSSADEPWTTTRLRVPMAPLRSRRAFLRACGSECAKVIHCGHPVH